MILRKKHAAVTTVAIIVIVLILLGVLLFARPAEAPEENQFVISPILSASSYEPEVRVLGKTNEQKRQQARAAVLNSFSSSTGDTSVGG